MCKYLILKILDNKAILSCVKESVTIHFLKLKQIWTVLARVRERLQAYRLFLYLKQIFSFTHSQFSKIRSYYPTDKSYHLCVNTWQETSPRMTQGRSGSSACGLLRKMSKEGEENGPASLWKHVWAWILVHLIAFKYNAIEIFTRHRKLNLERCGKRTGEVGVVTGGARGIGVEVVKNLMQCDMHVIIGCRNVSAGNQLIEKLRGEGVTSGTAETVALDLMSVDSVKHFASTVLAKHSKINVLINNAGIMFENYKETGDGYESHFQVNYLSPFLLTRLLHHALIKGAKENKNKRNSRVVNVSSCASFGGDIDFSDLQIKRSYSKFNAYMVTKFLQVISSNTLDRKYREEEAPVNSYSLHPGVVHTDLYDNIWWLQLFRCMLPLMFKSPAQGADTICYAALSPDIEKEGGLFLANSQPTPPNPKANNTMMQNQLWDITCDLLDNKVEK